MLKLIRELLERIRYDRAPYSLILTEGGFSLTRADRLEGPLSWSDVQEVVTFKEDAYAVEVICVVLRTKNGRELLISEDWNGFDTVMGEALRRLSEMEKDWWQKVAFPPFETNYHSIWPMCDSI